jgi:hypothetical protein
MTDLVRILHDTGGECADLSAPNGVSRSRTSEIARAGDWCLRWNSADFLLATRGGPLAFKFGSELTYVAPMHAWRRMASHHSVDGRFD